MSPETWLKILEELRAMAQMGLHYDSGDHYDRERYQRLLEISAELYALHSGLSAEILQQRFSAEPGHITPKVGADAAIFAPDERLFLVQRQDDLCWGLPSGWCDLNETPRQTLVREIREELDLSAQVGTLVEVFSRLPGDFGQAHTSYHLVFLTTLAAFDTAEVHCQPEEIRDWGWFELESVANWHRDHRTFALRAREVWRAQKA